MLRHRAYKGLRGSWEALSEGVSPRLAAHPLDPSAVTIITSNSARVFVALFLLLVHLRDDAFVDAENGLHSTGSRSPPRSDVDPPPNHVDWCDGPRVPDPQEAATEKNPISMYYYYN